MLTNAKNRKTVLMITLNPSLDFSRVEIIDAIEPNRMEPVIDAKIRNGIVSALNCTDVKKRGNPIAVIRILNNPAQNVNHIIFIINLGFKTIHV